MRSIKEAIEKKLEEKSKEIIFEIKDKVSKKLIKDENYIIRKIVKKIDQYFNRIDIGQQLLGFIDKEELDYLKKNIGKFFQTNNLPISVRNINDKNIFKNIVTYIALSIRNRVFIFLSQEKNNEYTLRKRLCLKKKDDIENSSEISQALQEACDDFEKLMRSKFTPEEIEDENKKLEELDLTPFNFVRMLFERAINVKRGIDDELVQSLMGELIGLLKNQKNSEISTAIFNFIEKNTSNSDIVHKILKTIKAKSKKLLPEIPSESGLEPIASLSRLPQIEFIKKHQKKYIKDNQLIAENKSSQRHVCYFDEHESSVLSKKKYVCFLKFGMNEVEQNAIILEYASYIFSRHMIGHGIPESELFMLETNLLTLATQSVKKIDRLEYIQKPETLNLDDQALAEFFFLMMVLAPGDLRHENCGIEDIDDKTGNKRLVFFDTEHNFQEGKDVSSLFRKLANLTNSRFAQLKSDVNNFILGLDYYMDKVINQLAIKKYLIQCPELVVKNWLEILQKKFDELQIRKHPITETLIKSLLTRMGILRIILKDADDENLMMTYRQLLSDFNGAISAAYPTGISSTQLRKSTSDMHFKISVGHNLNPIVSELELMSKVTHKSVFIPGHEEFDSIQFNKLPAHLKSRCLRKGNQDANAGEMQHRMKRQKKLVDDLAHIEFNRLYIFELNNNSELNSETLKIILNKINQQYDKLKRLSLQGCNISDKDLFLIFTVCRKLQVEKLDLSRTKITKFNIKRLLNISFFGLSSTVTLPSLKILLLNNCEHLTSIDLNGNQLCRVESQHCPQLENIIINTSAENAKAKFNGCILEKSVKYQYWLQVVQKDLRFAKFKKSEISVHSYKTIFNLSQKLNYFTNEGENDIYFYCQDDSANSTHSTPKLLRPALEEKKAEPKEYSAVSQSKMETDGEGFDVSILGSDQFYDSILLGENDLEIKQSILIETKEILEKNPDFYNTNNNTNNENSFSHYVKHLKLVRKLTPTTILVYARLNKLKIRLWLPKVNVNNQGMLELQACNFFDKNNEAIDLIYFELLNTVKVLTIGGVLKINKNFNKHDLELIFEAIYYDSTYNIKLLEVDLTIMEKLETQLLKTFIDFLGKNKSIQKFYSISNDKTKNITKNELLNKLILFLPPESDTSSSEQDNMNEKVNSEDELKRKSKASEKEKEDLKRENQKLANENEHLHGKLEKIQVLAEAIPVSLVTHNSTFPIPGTKNREQHRDKMAENAEMIIDIIKKKPEENEVTKLSK